MSVAELSFLVTTWVVSAGEKAQSLSYNLPGIYSIDKDQQSRRTRDSARVNIGQAVLDCSHTHIRTLEHSTQTWTDEDCGIMI